MLMHHNLTRGVQATGLRAGFEKAIQKSALIPQPFLPMFVKHGQKLFHNMAELSLAVIPLCLKLVSDRLAGYKLVPDAGLAGRRDMLVRAPKKSSRSNKSNKIVSFASNSYC